MHVFNFAFEFINGRMKDEDKMAAEGKLFNKNYLLLWQGQFVSKIGSQLYMMAAVMWIVEYTGSAKILATVGAVGAAIAAILGPFTGTIADQYSRKRIIVTTDLLNGLVICGFAGITFLRPDDTNLIVMLLIIIAMVSATLNSFFGPAIEAAVPDLVPRKRLAAANSLSQLSTQVSAIGGQTVSGILFTFFGAPLLFLFNGLSYLFSSVSEMFITIPQALTKKPESKKEFVQNFKVNLGNGFKYIGQKQGLKHVVILYALLTFFTQPVILLMSFFVKDFLNVGEMWKIWLSFLSAGYGFGTLIGFALANIIRARGNNRVTLVIIATLLNAAAFVVFGMLRNPFQALALVLGAGIFSGFVMVNLMVILQASTPSEIRGRVFGVLGMLNGILTPISMSFSGIVAEELLDYNIPVIYYFCGISMVIVVLIMTSFKQYRYFISND